MEQLFRSMVMMVAGSLVWGCGKEDGQPIRDGMGSNAISGTFAGTTTFQCVPASSGSFSDTLIVSSVAASFPGVIVRGDTFLQQMDTTVLMFVHGSSYLIYTKPGQFMNVKLHWLGDDGHGTPGCDYLFEANY
jgi:hypothetical protein